MATKIPPHIARELRRHVAPKARAAAGPTSAGRGGAAAAAGDSGGGRMGKGATLAACCAFTAATASIPYLVMKWFEPLNEKDGALTPNQIRRGAFMNSGSRDVGKDPMWDFATGTRIKDRAYVELFEKDDGPDAVDHGDRYLAEAQRRQRR